MYFVADSRDCSCSYNCCVYCCCRLLQLFREIFVFALIYLVMAAQLKVFSFFLLYLLIVN